LQLHTHARPSIRRELLTLLSIDLLGCRSSRLTVSSQVRHDTKQPLDDSELRPVMHFVRLRIPAKIDVWFSSRNVQKAMVKIRPRYLARSPVSIFSATKFIYLSKSLD